MGSSIGSDSMRAHSAVKPPVVFHHAKCGLRFDAHNGDYDCEYAPTIACEDCKYGGFGGKKDPEARCNQQKDRSVK